MSDATTHVPGLIDRRTLIKAGAVGAAAITTGVITAGPAEAKPHHDHRHRKLHLRVVADLDAFNYSAYDSGPLAGGDPGPFYIPGKIYEPGDGGAEIGAFHCWGFFFVAGGALGVVNQEYNLWDRGKIMAAGVEDEGPRAVTGGTGRFKNVRGQITGADLSGFPEFEVWFKLIG